MVNSGRFDHPYASVLAPVTLVPPHHIPMCTFSCSCKPFFIPITTISCKPFFTPITTISNYLEFKYMLMLISSFFGAHRIVSKFVLMGEWCLWVGVPYKYFLNVIVMASKQIIK